MSQSSTASGTSSTGLTSFGGLEPQYRDPATSEIAVIPVPYDLTSSWKKGADRGPAALLAASANLELYDIPTHTEVYQRGIWTTDPVICQDGPEKLAEMVEQVVSERFDAGQLPVVIGGEHSVAIGAIRAAAKRYDKLTVLQIDAHGDTREEYDGSPCNHACVMARAREVASITQVGIRAIDAAEVEKLDDDRVFYGHHISRSRNAGDVSWMDDVVQTLDENVYITIDLDAFDPAFLPATGTPEPDGLSWYEVNELIDRVAGSRSIVGFDVVELLPTPGQWASEFFAAKLVYRVLSMIHAVRDT
jgi:agmatinase